MDEKKTEVYGVSTEEFLSRMKVIFESSIQKVLKPKKEQPVGIKELANHFSKSVQWVYKKKDANQIRYYQYGGKNSKLEFFISEVEEDLRKSTSNKIVTKTDTNNLIP